MIDTLFIANYLQNLLNTGERKYVIFADEGDLKKSVKDKDKVIEYTHGVVKIVSTTIVPVKALSLSTINAQLTLIVNLAQDGYVEIEENGITRKQSISLISVKKDLDNLISQLNGQVVVLNDGEKSYTSNIALSQPTNGLKMALGEINEGLPLYINLSLVTFENGVNANECHYYVNGEDIYFTKLTITKVSTNDQAQFVNGKTGKSYALTNGRSFDMVIPTINSDVSKSIMKDILGTRDTNTALAVRVDTPLEKNNYICIFGNNAINIELGTNCGYNTSFVEGVPNQLIYDEHWTTQQGSGTIELEAKTGAIIFWGDDTSTYAESDSTYSHTYTDTRAHTIRIWEK